MTSTVKLYRDKFPATCPFRKACRRDTSRDAVVTTPRVLYTQISSRNVCYKRVVRATQKTESKKPRSEGETRKNGCGVFRAKPFVTPRASLARSREGSRNVFHGVSTTNQSPIWSEANTGITGCTL